jgi:hypothetical protein
MRWIERNSLGKSISSCGIQRGYSSTYAFRLKKVQGKKKRDTAAADLKKQAAAAGGTKALLLLDNDEQGGLNLLSDRDEDVIF